MDGKLVYESVYWLLNEETTFFRHNNRFLQTEVTRDPTINESFKTGHHS